MIPHPGSQDLVAGGVELEAVHNEQFPPRLAVSAHRGIEGIEVIAVQSLAQAVAFLSGEIEIEPTPSRLDGLFRELANYEVDFSDVCGQEMAKRAIIVAAAGGHNLLRLWSKLTKRVSGWQVAA